VLEKLTGLIEKLAETRTLTFLVLFVVGAVLLATAATGGWSQLAISVSDPLWRDIIAGCGIVLMIAAITFSFLERKQPNLPSREKAGISISDPRDGTRVRVPCPVTGQCNRLPAGFKLWLFVIGGQGKGLHYWPHDEISVSRDRSWRTELRATNFKDGDPRRFAIFLVGEDGQALIHQFKTSGAEIDRLVAQLRSADEVIDAQRRLAEERVQEAEEALRKAERKAGQADVRSRGQESREPMIRVSREPASTSRGWPPITILTQDMVPATDECRVTISHE
jgi:hypothetical protein